MDIWINITGIIGIIILVCILVWFCAKPIARDQLLVTFNWKYFGLVALIMVSCTCVITWALSMHWMDSINSGNDFLRAIQYSLKMKEAKDGDLNILSFILVMLFQVVVFEGLVLATIVGWTGRRAKRYQSGEVRYHSVNVFKGIFRQNNFAVVIGANEVAPSVIKNLLKHEDKKKNSLNYAHEKENAYVILQTSGKVAKVRQLLQAFLTEDEYNRVIIYSDLRNSYEGLDALHLQHASEIYVLGENTTTNGGETFHDTMNMRCVNMIAKVLIEEKKRRKDLQKVVCKVLFEYQTTYSIFQFSDVADEVNETMHFIPFNRYESWARRVIVDNHALALIDENDQQGKHTIKHENKVTYTPLDGFEGIRHDSPQRVHFIVVGMSKMGVAMGVQALFQAHYPNYVTDNRLKSRITFIDANAEQEMQFFKGRYASLFELARHRYIDANTCSNAQVNSKYGWVDPTHKKDYPWKHLSKNGKNFLDVEIEFVKGELESDGVREYLRQVTADEKSKVTIAICLPETHQAVAAALYMPAEVYPKVQEIWVYQREAADIITNLNPINNTTNHVNEHYKKLKPFGMLYGEYIDSRTYYLKALLVNGIYKLDDPKLLTPLDMDRKDTYKVLRQKWNSLSVELKWSNKYFADTIYQKIRSALPTPLAKDAAIGGYNNPAFFCEGWHLAVTEALKNATYLAECEHNRWNVQQLLLGFTPADITTDEAVQNKNGERSKEELKQFKNELKSPKKKIHCCICDFDHLDTVDPGAKDYDQKLNDGIPLILNLVDGYHYKEKTTNTTN